MAKKTAKTKTAKAASVEKVQTLKNSTKYRGTNKPTSYDYLTHKLEIFKKYIQVNPVFVNVYADDCRCDVCHKGSEEVATIKFQDRKKNPDGSFIYRDFTINYVCTTCLARINIPYITAAQIRKAAATTPVSVSSFEAEKCICMMCDQEANCITGRIQHNGLSLPIKICEEDFEKITLTDKSAVVLKDLLETSVAYDAKKIKKPRTMIFSNAFGGINNGL